MARDAWAVAMLLVSGCASGGSAWMSQPLTERAEDESVEPATVRPPGERPSDRAKSV